MTTPQAPNRTRLDRAGIVLSGLCALHCLAGVVLVGMLGIGGEALLDPMYHRVGLALAVTIGLLTIGFGALRHRRREPLIIGMSGLALMTGGLFVQHGLSEVLLTVAGVTLVAIAHILNLRASR